jgi:hypothetical protein
MDIWQLLAYNYALSRKWFNLNWEDGYTLEDVKKEYRRLAKLYHSDVNEYSSDEMREIIDAYNFLKYDYSKDEDIIHSSILKSLKKNFLWLVDKIEDDDIGCIMGKKSKRLVENAKEIRKQVLSIKSIVIKSFKALDLYIIQNHNTDITNYITSHLQNTLDEEATYYGQNPGWYKNYMYQRTKCEMFAASMNYDSYRSIYFKYWGNSSPSEVGKARNDMRKARNRACRDILSFTKDMSIYIRIINNGMIDEVTFNKNDKALINLTYLNDYDNLCEYISKIRNSSNYYCYIPQEEKTLYSLKKIKK